MSEIVSGNVQRQSRKRPDCPNCSGRSFGPDAAFDYIACRLCERPDDEFHEWYAKEHPEAYKKFMGES